MVARSNRSNQRPDTLMQDRSPPARRKLLQRTAGPYKWVTNGHRVTSASGPLHPQKRTSTGATSMSGLGQSPTSRQRRSQRHYRISSTLHGAMISVTLQSLHSLQLILTFIANEPTGTAFVSAGYAS